MKRKIVFIVLIIVFMMGSSIVKARDNSTDTVTVEVNSGFDEARPVPTPAIPKIVSEHDDIKEGGIRNEEGRGNENGGLMFAEPVPAPQRK